MAVAGCVGWINAAAQSAPDTLQEVGVRGERKATDARAATFSPGLRVATLDSAVLRLYNQQSLATLLAEQSSVFVKSYGFNALATLNFRGASAAQSAVLWNGVPLQNAALGLADVSLLPVSLVDKVSVLYGASAGLWGSGAVGGAVLLESDRARFEQGHRRLDASVSAGSFGQLGALLRGDASGKRLAISVRAFGQRADNDFWIPATIFSPEERQRNAALRAGGTLIRAAAKLSSRETLEAHGWLQAYDRHIPRTLSESSSIKAQTDRNLRGLLHYRREGRVELGAKVAGFADALHYDDAASRTHSANNSRQVFGEASARWRRKDERFETLLFTPVQVSWMRRADDSLVSQRRAALAAAGKGRVFDARLEAVITARLEHIDDRTVFLPGVNAAFKTARWLSIRGALQRTYRASTLNELHYVPGGNPALKPEEGWGGEVGYSVRAHNRGSWSFRQDATAYHREIRNWILWYGSAIWTPHNIAAVRSQGIELENRWTITLARKSQLVIANNVAYAQARTIESVMPGDGSIGKQLPYTPKVLANASVGLVVKRLFVSYQHSYTGLRFVTADESFGLPAYHTGNVSAMWEGNVGQHTAAISLRAANIWDEAYTVVAGRPMPGRHFLLTARFGFL